MGDGIYWPTNIAQQEVVSHYSSTGAAANQQQSALKNVGSPPGLQGQVKSFDQSVSGVARQ
jgi:hypothetical protein